MDKVQLISANQKLVVSLEQRFGELLVHANSIESAASNAASGNIGTTIIEGYEKLATLRKIITVLRDASPSMAITCLVKPDNVRKIINSELKPYIYRILPSHTSIGQIVLAANSSQQEHKALQKRAADGENLTVELRHDASFGPFLPTASRNFWITITGSLVCISVLTGLVLSYNIKSQNETKSSPQQPSSASTTITTPKTLQKTEEETPSTDMAMLEFIPEAPINNTATLLSKANDAMLNNQLVDPYGDNAVTYFKQVLTIDQQNPEALSGLTQIEAMLVKRIETALRAGNKQQASIDIVTLRSLYPEHARLAELSTRLLKSDLPIETDSGSEKNITKLKPSVQARSTKAPVPISEPPSVQDQVNNILRRADEHIETNHFDTAISILNSRTPTVSAYRKLFDQRVTRIRNILLRSGNIAIVEQDFASANESIRLLDRLGLNNDANGLKQRLGTAAATITEEIFTPASSISISQPKYPKSALRRNIEGHVLLSFMVQADGAIDDIQIIDSAPSDIFNEAAIEAIISSRYRAATRGGIAEDQRVQQRLNFNLANE